MDHHDETKPRWELAGRPGLDPGTLGLEGLRVIKGNPLIAVRTMRSCASVGVRSCHKLRALLLVPALTKLSVRQASRSPRAPWCPVCRHSWVGSGTSRVPIRRTGRLRHALARTSEPGSPRRHASGIGRQATYRRCQVSVEFPLDQHSLDWGTAWTSVTTRIS
jgi:hypothetical protein